MNVYAFVCLYGLKDNFDGRKAFLRSFTEKLEQNML